VAAKTYKSHFVSKQQQPFAYVIAVLTASRRRIVGWKKSLWIAASPAHLSQLNQFRICNER